MKRFEYDIVKIVDNLHNEDLIKKVLNERGAEGWELTNSVPYIVSGRQGYAYETGKLNLFFKREIEL